MNLQRTLDYPVQPLTPFLTEDWRSLPTPVKRQLAARLQQRIIEQQTISRLDLTGYRYDPARYIREQLGWHPWAGTPDAPGQVEILEAYTLALRQQHERLAFERGESYDATVWQPGQPIRNRIRIEAGHGVGKTKLSSGILSHFFDCFTPSICYTFAPTWQQISTLLWKEIKSDRRRNRLPGRVLETCEIRTDDARHFAQGRATQNGDTESIQGQHNPYLMFILDEAEGMPEYVWSSIDSMTSGGISIVIMLGNPRTRTSRFHKI